jgi:hypothetical protein
MASGRRTLNIVFVTVIDAVPIYIIAHSLATALGD